MQAFFDATFACVPHPFYQLLILQIWDVSLNIYLPVIYILMTGKTEQCYQQAFDYIKWEVPGFEPYSGGLDFELAFFRTAKKAFPKMEMIGCLFHFKKSIREKMEKLGIDKKEIGIAMKWGALDLITVLPPNELLEKGVDFVKEHVMNLIFEFYCAEGNLESCTSEKKWDEFWAYFM